MALERAYKKRSPNDLILEEIRRAICGIARRKRQTAMQNKPMLTLRARPQLATHCYFLANASRADVLWTRDDFRAVCHRMLNGNSEHYFMMCYFDETKRKAVFPKSKRVRASKRIEWAFDTICGKAKNKTGIGFYPDNDDDETCWAALDFDAHNQEERLGRAYVFAGKAFDLLCREAPFLWVIAGTSGQSGGWHIFAFSPYFYPTREWTRFLREVADRIAAPIQKGICEIFPDDNRGQKKGIRAPGSWNPKDDSFGLIAYDSLTAGLKRPTLDKEKSSLSILAKATREGTVPLPSRQILPAYRGEDGRWKSDFAITAVRSRRDKLSKLVGTAFFQVSKGVARENARLQYLEASPAPRSSLDQHLADFDELWDGMEREWFGSLSPLERDKFGKLTSDNYREAFRIVRNWSRAENSDDFKIVCESLAARLAASIPTASSIRLRFCSAGILKQTAEYVPHKLAARYRWIANANNDSLIEEAKEIFNATEGQNTSVKSAGRLEDLGGSKIHKVATEEQQTSSPSTRYG